MASQATLSPAQRDCKIARYDEVRESLWYIVKARGNNKDKPAAAFVEFIELGIHGRKVAVPMHPAESTNLKAMGASLTSDLEMK